MLRILVLAAALGLVNLFLTGQKAAQPAVQTGIEVLAAGGFDPLRGKRVGLITNPTGVNRNLRATVDILASAPGVRLVALYGPEHGVRGDARAGQKVASAKDPATGLPVHSLYGSTTKPTAAMLKGVDLLVFDIQDIGSRSYTYIYTMGRAMEAAAENGIPFMVLDRPNPVGGDRVEGNITESGFRSAVSPYPVPYCHGLTVGELASMINQKGWIKQKCDLTIIEMKGWRRNMNWVETGLPWVPTSPHIPKPESAHFYAATGIVGELPSVSIGVGYTLPFELAGRPGIGARSFANEMNRRNLPGVFFRPMSWTPFYAIFKGQPVGGAQIYVEDANSAELTRLNFEVMDAIRKLSPSTKLFGASTRMFDLVCGTDTVRKGFLSGQSGTTVWRSWNQGSAGFRSTRKPYLLYD
jgi:uncharacterized protein YbbC (DUF1343 family)